MELLLLFMDKVLGLAEGEKNPMSLVEGVGVAGSEPETRKFCNHISTYETGQSVGGAKTGVPREKPPGTPASRTWLVSHVTRAGLEPTPDTVMR